MELYDASGHWLAGSYGVGDREQVSLGGLPAGIYYVHVYGYACATNPDYTLTLNTPVQVADDPYEANGGNNDPTHATALGTITGQWQRSDLSISPSGDLDWFQFSLAAAGTALSSVTIDFDPGPGNLGLILFDSSAHLVGQATGVGGWAQISLQGQAAGSFFAVVYGVQGATNPQYTLTIQAPDVGQAVGDWAEPNNSQTSAYDLGTVQGLGTWGLDPNRPLSISSSTDDDWFKFTTGATAGPGDFVGIAFDHSLGDLDLKVFDDSNHLVGWSDGTGDTELVQLDGQPAGTYYVHVYGYAGAVNPSYALAIHGPGGDRFEPNNSYSVATQLRFASGVHQEANLSIDHAGDEDWFSFSLAATATVANYARIDFNTALGDLDLYLYKSTDTTTPIRSSAGVSDSEVIPLTDLPAGTYYVRVVGYNDADQSQLHAHPLHAGPAHRRHLRAQQRPVQATDLGTVSGALTRDDPDHPLSIDNPNDVDWFRFQTVAAGVAGQGAGITFRQSEGDLDLYLYDANGNQIDQSTGIGDSETVSLAGRPAGVYYLKVVGYRQTPNDPGQTNPHYALWIIAPAESRGDVLEPNDSIAQATDLGTISGPTARSGLSIDSPTDVDYFKFQIAAGAVQGEGIGIVFDNSMGNLDLRLYDSGGHLLATSAGTGDTEVISMAGRPAGTYYAEVYGQANPTYGRPSTDPRGRTATGFNRTTPSVRPPTLPRSPACSPGPACRSSRATRTGSSSRPRARGRRRTAFALLFDQTQGQLDLYVYDSNLQEVGHWTKPAGLEWVSLQGEPAGTYYVEVVGHQGQSGQPRQSNPRYALPDRRPPAQCPVRLGRAE